MEKVPNRRLIIRKKLVPKEGEQPPTTIPPVTYGSICTFNPITDTPKKCPCGGYYTSDSEYIPRECCSGLYTHGVHYKLFDGRYTPDYTPADEKQKCHCSFDKPVIYDFTSDKFTSTTANTPAKETTSGFNIMPASKLRETQREDKRDTRDSRNTSRDWSEDKRDSRNDRDYHRSRERDYVRNTRVTDVPNSYNGARREPSKFKSDLDSELGKYGRKF